MESVADPVRECRLVNTLATSNLARQAAQTGIRRFVFLSSIGVNGSETFDRPFTPDDTPAPISAYAISKYEAEISLVRIARETGLEVVIIRPPLVFGPGVRGNFE